MTLQQSADFLARVIKPATLQLIEGKAHDLDNDNFHSFLKNAFAALGEDG